MAYSGAGIPLWTNTYKGPADFHDQATAVAVDGSGNVFVTGGSSGGYATIKYSGEALLSISLDYHIVGNQLLLGWTNAAFSLQSASTVRGPYSTIPGATSPYSTDLSGTERYFRLKGN